MKLILMMFILSGCMTPAKPLPKAEFFDIDGRQLSEWSKLCSRNGGIKRVEFKPNRLVKCAKNKVTFIW